MKEATKTLATFTEDQKKDIFSKTGIDIGCGNDLIVPHFKPFDKDQGDANRLSQYGLGNFHCVSAIHCLQHLINPYRSIQDMWDLVQPNGYLVIAVPDEDLYEQGKFPSRWNKDHKWTFTIQKDRSWSSNSVNIKDLLKLLSDYEIIKLQLQDKGYDYSLKNTDQTESQDVMAQILLVLRRINK